MNLFDFSPESLKNLYKFNPEHIISFLQHSWLNVATTAAVFELARGRDADMKAICEICMSDPRPEIRSMAVTEMTNIMPWADVVKAMWA